MESLWATIVLLAMAALAVAVVKFGMALVAASVGAGLS